MAFQPVVNTAKISLEGSLNGAVIVNTLYFRSTGGAITETSLNDLVADVRNWWRDRMLPEMPTSYTFERIVGTDLTIDGGLQEEKTPAEDGAVLGGILPNNVAYVIKFTTGFSGRSKRGRNYLAGLRVADVNDNTLSEAQASAYIGIYQQILPGGVDAPAGFEWVIVSRYSDGALRPSGLVTPITGVSVTDRRVDTMRKRLPKA